MRAIEFREFGDPSQLKLVERPDPRPAESGLRNIICSLQHMICMTYYKNEVGSRIP
jgi:hypothetical protein